MRLPVVSAPCFIATPLEALADRGKGDYRASHYLEDIVAVVDGRKSLCDELAAERLAFAKGKLAHYMAPKSIDFIVEMPRLPTGKLYKRLLKDQYWQAGKAI